MEAAVSTNERFLKDFVNERLSSPPEEYIQFGMVGNYTLKLNDVEGEVIDWILHYLEQRSCPHYLSVFLAKNVAKQISASVRENVLQGNEESLNGNYIPQQASSLHSDVIKKLHELCNQLVDNPDQTSMSYLALDLPYTASVFAIKNRRRKMEDRHVIIHDLNSLCNLKDMPPHSYYAVFDGHAGVEAASFAAAHLHMNIVKHPEFLIDTEEAIKEAFKKTDNQFHERAVLSGVKSGCTAVCALIRDNVLYLAWLGDSQALLVKQGNPVTIMKPHKPEREDERQRIEKLGGYVCHIGTWRVNGTLAVSRALGDQDHKPYVSSEPEVKTIPLDGTEDFLILACDGLWDGMSPADVSVTLYKHLADNFDSNIQETLAEKLVTQSKNQGSEDNITTIVIFLRDVESVIKDAPKYTSVFPQLEGIELNEMKIFNGKENLTEEMEQKNDADKINCKPSDVFSNPLNDFANFVENKLYNYSPQRPQTLRDGADFHSLNADYADCLHYDRIDHAAFYGEAVGLPPEATALSELPTPPIDDVLANEQFSNFPSEEQFQQFHLHLETEKMQGFEIDSQITNPFAEGYISQQPASVADSLEADVCVSPTAFEEKNLNQDDSGATENLLERVQESTEELAAKNITPEEAVIIASDVVANTIETAVKQVEDTSRFTADSIGEIIGSPQKLNPYAKPFIMPNDSFSFQDTDSKSPVISKDDSQQNYEQQLLNPFMEELSLVQENTSENTSKNDSASQSDNVLPPSLTNTEEVCTFESNITPTSKEDNEVKSLDAFQMKEIMQVVQEIQTVTDVQDMLPNIAPSVMEDEILHLEGNKTDNAVITDEVLQPVINTQNDYTETCENTKQFLDTSVENKAQASSLVISDAEISDIKAESINIDDEVRKSETVDTCPKNFEEENQASPDGILTKNDSLNVEPVLQPIESVVDYEITSEDSEKKLLKSNVDPLQIPVEDSQLQTSAVDLHAIPDGLPEAEGVTEDIDSDSEKDGGWSYVKGTTNDVEKKSESKAPSAKDKKSTEKSIPSSSVKVKDKNIKDANERIKTSVSTEKYKKPVVEKKVTDTKEKPTTEKRITGALNNKSKIGFDRRIPTNKEKSVPDKKLVENKVKVTSSVKSTSMIATSTKSVKTSVPASVPAGKITQPKTQEVKKSAPTAAASKIQRTAPKTQPIATKTTTRPNSGISVAAKPAQQKPVTSSTVKTAPRSTTAAAATTTTTIQQKEPASKSTSMQKIPSRPTTAVSKNLPSRGLPTSTKTNVSHSVSETKSTLIPPARKLMQSSQKSDVKEAKDSVNKQIASKFSSQNSSHAKKLPFVTSTPKPTGPLKRVSANATSSTHTSNKGTKSATSKISMAKGPSASKTSVKSEKPNDAEVKQDDPNKIAECNDSKSNEEKGLIEVLPSNEADEKFQLEERVKEIDPVIQNAASAVKDSISDETVEKVNEETNKTVIIDELPTSVL